MNVYAGGSYDDVKIGAAKGNVEIAASGVVNSNGNQYVSAPDSIDTIGTIEGVAEVEDEEVDGPNAEEEEPEEATTTSSEDLEGMSMP